MRLRLALIGLALIGTTTAIAACGDDSGSSSKTTAAVGATTAAAAPDIVISNFSFQVQPAKVGTITVKNKDTAKHTVTADDGSFNVTVEAGATATFSVAKAGSFTFHCNIHSSMKGTLVVS